MRLLKSKTGDAIDRDQRDFTSISSTRIRQFAISKDRKNAYNLMKDDAFASFEYKGVTLER